MNVTKQKQKVVVITHVGKDVEKSEPLYSADGNTKWFSHVGNRLELSQIATISVTMSSSSSTSRCICKRL
jgi:hypothetical protein